jgi:hypothetical protein
MHDFDNAMQRHWSWWPSTLYAVAHATRDRDGQLEYIAASLEVQTSTVSSIVVHPCTPTLAPRLQILENEELVFLR